MRPIDTNEPEEKPSMVSTAIRSLLSTAHPRRLQDDQNKSLFTSDSLNG